MTEQKEFTVTVTAQWQLAEVIATDVAEQMERIGYRCIAQSDPAPAPDGNVTVTLVCK
jgi:hypothetical protein